MTTFPSDPEQKLLADEFGSAVRNMTIGFLKFTKQVGQENVQPAGTGTLISVGSVFGVLTASHVLHELPDHGEVGLVRFRIGQDQPQKTKIVSAQSQDGCSSRGTDFWFSLRRETR